ncbi:MULTISPECIES: Cro/CI family transcriptional regulator [Klebsiella/Raoultella group]|jgi:DNA-binding transcriptional regulator YdaS (Cro superfamily)|uniref:Cro/CI family transcriptional regulator n=1 Tax=Klebsiella/Raoultella group TaxID=2890311 RepID=UPI0005370C89|nr:MULTISPECIES: Cro/CI family transcriptional regulator [Klebsiella/Raoultella group]CAH5391152.1 hypothetical protein AI2932V1_3109 [Klebsiella pneumoniae]DAM03585.1 MAG TPA: DNA-binding transcriptional regulator [Caudoviricetes sp.]AYZ19566.1 hypothetical protein EGY08_24190 [Klebsiella sp. FDAARGOS_511]EKT7901390.1 helix-turn-helix domain-containing protein [Klebsiella oxytoca]EKV4193550.1 helix-turn-helix domain-containing protein [Klebsiella michiganensis]
MLKAKVVTFYGGISKTATALGVTHSAVCQWGDVIPEKQALYIERLTDGRLKYDASLYHKNINPTTQQ